MQLTVFLVLVPFELARWAEPVRGGPIAANTSADGPAPGASPTWLGGAAVGSGAIGTGTMSGLLQLSVGIAVASLDW